MDAFLNSIESIIS